MALYALVSPFQIQPPVTACFWTDADMDTAAPISPHWKMPRSAQRPFDALAECLALLTHYYQHPFSTETLVSGLPLENGKLTPELFVRAAARADLSARVMRRPLDEISPNTLPVVLLLKDQQACIVLSHDAERQRDHEGACGEEERNQAAVRLRSRQKHCPRFMKVASFISNPALNTPKTPPTARSHAMTTGSGAFSGTPGRSTPRC